jgi:hypothetical protein
VGLSIEWLSLTTAEIHMNFRVSYGNGQYWLPIVKHPTSRNLVYDGSEQMLVEGEWETNPKVNQANYYAVTTEEKSIDELEWTVLPKGECPKATDAGVYHIYYKAVKDLGGKGYFVAYWVGTTVIAPAEFDYSLPQAKDLTYNGKEQELVTPPEEGTYTVTYSLDQKEYEEAIPTAKEAGKYTVFYKISNGSNYIEVTGQVEVEIKAGSNGGTTPGGYVYPAPVEEKTNPEENGTKPVEEKTNPEENNTKPEEENTNLEEEETPLTEEPEVVEETDEEMTDIEEAEVAKDEKPHLKEKEVAPVSDIGDDEVPLSDNPITGDVLPIMWICLGVLALIGLGGILVVKRKEE